MERPTQPSAKRAPKSKRKIGTPYTPTEEQRELVRMLTAYGIPQDDIVKMVINPNGGRPISEVTLREHFRTEIDQGKAQADVKVVGALFKNATTPSGVYPGGVPSCQIFWVKARLGWRTTDPETELPPAPAGEERGELETARRIAYLLHLASKKPPPAALPRPKVPA